MPHFPFGPDDVAEVHTHKDGIGDGVWFRLADGRVFNASRRGAGSAMEALPLPFRSCRNGIVSVTHSPVES